MTFTEMPSAMTSVIADSPGMVAGIFIMTFSRSTAVYSALACWTVLAVSIAKPGSTSMDTLPSTPFVEAYTSANKSQAARTSSVVASKIASSALAPRLAS